MSSSNNKTDHQRVLEILHRVDLTAEQRLANQELRDAVLDAEDAVCMLEQQLRIHQLNNDCVAAIQVAQQRLSKFENEISYAHSTTRQEDEQYARECGLVVDGKQFLSEETRLTSLRGIDVARDRLQRIQPDSDLSRSFVEGALAVLDQAETVAIEHKLDTSPWATVMDSALQAVATMVHENRGALNPLKALDDKIDQLRREANREVELQHEAIEAGDVTSSEDHVKSRMALLEGVSGLIQQKFKLLSQIESGPLVKAQLEAKAAQEQLSKAAIEVFERHDTHLEDLETDCDRLDEYRGRGRQNEQEARSLFMEQRSQSDQFLAENLDKQTHCWKELLKIEAQLSALAEERREEVERRVRSFEREERRRSDMGHFVNFADSRQKQLARAVDNIITEKRVGGALADIVDKAVYTLSEEVAVMQNAVKETKKKMLEEHAGHFREQYLTVGELLFRKERLLEECDKKIVELRMQQEIAMDTLDPKARLISEQRASFEQQREEVLRFVNLLRNKTSSYIEAFRPSDAAIRSTTGIASSFNATEAMEELRRQNESRSQALDHYFTHMAVETAKTEDALGRPKPNNEWRVHPKLLASEAEIDMEKAEIAATKDIIAQHRRKTLAALSSNNETDPKLRAKKYLSRRLSTASGLYGDAEDPPDTLMNNNTVSNKRRKSTAIFDEKEYDNNDDSINNNDGETNNKTPSPRRASASSAIMTGGGRRTNKTATFAASTPEPSSSRQQANPNITRRKSNNNNNNPMERSNNHRNNSTNFSAPTDDTVKSGLPQGSGKRNSLAEKLSTALRVSALGLNDRLEPYEGRALKDLEKINRTVERQHRKLLLKKKRRQQQHNKQQQQQSHNNNMSAESLMYDDEDHLLDDEDFNDDDTSDDDDYDDMENDDFSNIGHQSLSSKRSMQSFEAFGGEGGADEAVAEEGTPRRFKGIVPDPHTFDDFKIESQLRNSSSRNKPTVD